MPGTMLSMLDCLIIKIQISIFFFFFALTMEQNKFGKNTLMFVFVVHFDISTFYSFLFHFIV